MAASLDKRLLAWAFFRMGQWSSLCRCIPELMDQTEAEEADPQMLWRMSLLLAKECKLSSQDNKTSTAAKHDVLIDRQLDGASDHISTSIGVA